MVVLETGGASLRLDARAVAQVSIGATWSPLDEAMLSLRSLWQQPPNQLVAAWQRNVHSRLGDWVVPLRLFASGTQVDLHTVLGAAPDLDSALVALASAPAERLQEELEPLRRATTGRAGWAPEWLGDLARGDERALTALANVLQRYHEAAIAPYWNAIRAYLDADRADLGQVMARRGVDGLLGYLHPRIRWRPPVLDVGLQSEKQRGSVHELRGRPLVVVPSVFCLDGPLVLRSGGVRTAPWLLVYPALRTTFDASSLWTPGAAGADVRALARLLGSTRARALHAIDDAPATTTGLAQRLGVAPATASHHVAALRGAQLVVSSRWGTGVTHRLTPLGAALLGRATSAGDTGATGA